MNKLVGLSTLGSASNTGGADKLVKEQALAKTDLELANSKLLKLSEQIRALEEKLQNAYNENAKLKVKHKEDKALEEILSLENFVKMLTVKLTDLDRQSLFFREKFVKLNALFSSCFELVKEEQKLATQKAQQRFYSLHGQLLNAKSEKDSLHSVNQELKNKISELQNDQKVTMAKHAEECHLAEEKARRLESEVETLLSKKSDMDNQIIMLEDKIRSLSEASRLSEIQMQEFQLQHSESETATAESIRNLQSEIHGKEEEIDTLQKEIVKHEEHVDSLEKQLSQLHSSLQEKEQVVSEFKEREKQLEDQKSEAQKLLAEAESNVAEAKKQFTQMLESKQLELSRHLKEISQRNDQAIKDIRRRYEAEKQECIKFEKEKAEKAVVDMEKKWDQKLSECKEELKQQLMKIEGERTALMMCREDLTARFKFVNLALGGEKLGEETIQGCVKFFECDLDLLNHLENSDSGNKFQYWKKNLTRYLDNHATDLDIDWLKESGDVAICLILALEDIHPDTNFKDMRHLPYLNVWEDTVEDFEADLCGKLRDSDGPLPVWSVQKERVSTMAETVPSQLDEVLTLNQCVVYSYRPTMYSEDPIKLYYNRPGSTYYYFIHNKARKLAAMVEFALLGRGPQE